MRHLVQCLTESVSACYSNTNSSNPWLESCIGLQTWKGTDLQRIQVKSTGVCRAVEPQKLHFKRTMCCQQNMQKSPSRVLTDAPLTRIWICSPTVGALSLFLLTCNRSTRGRMVIPCSKNHKTKNQAVFTPSILTVLALLLLEQIHRHGPEPQLPQPLQQE